jgi:5-methylcytosine-specific restriction protein A
MTPRKSLPAAKRKAFFKQHGGICYLCSGLINPVREAWQIEHYVALGMGGADNTKTNGELVHSKCHLAKTRQDVKDIALAKRRETKNLGATPPPRRPIQSPGFPKRTKPEKLPIPPRRSIYQ